MAPKVNFTKTYAQQLSSRLSRLRQQGDLVLTAHRLGPQLLPQLKAGGHPEGVNGFAAHWQQYGTSIQGPWVKLTNLTLTTGNGLVEIIAVMDESGDLAEVEVSRYRDQLNPTVAGYRGLSAPPTAPGPGTAPGVPGGPPPANP